MQRHSLAAGLLAASLAGCGGVESPALPPMKLDPARVAVVGISSGAYMAQQVHVAFSDRITGAALLAGGPYGCAENSLQTALSRCIAGSPDLPDIEHLAGRAQQLAQAGKIASLGGLDGDRVLVAHGSKDALVSPAVTQASLDLYLALQRDHSAPFAASLTLRSSAGEYAHVWPTLASGGDCGTTEAPYIGNCNLDFAGEVFGTLFDASASAPPQATGELLRFDQNTFLPGGTDAYLDDSGLLYRPKQCGDANACGLLIAFHGCEMHLGAIGEVFARDSGLNRWADVANVVVLYPQTRATYMPLNPKACWDWWGYSGTEHDTRDGVQLRWLANVTAALGVPLAP
jgi:poly(3-hydroxybutyrate) depolymerase